MSKGMVSMDHSLAKLVAEWKVSLETIIPYIRNKQTFKDLVNIYKN
jgi:hypothetical protein